MKLFLIILLVFEGLNVLLYLVNLASSSYPRLREVAPWEDVFGLVCAIGFTVWISLLL
jgi:hypothetical protein